VGATAAALGDRLASPFVHEEQADGRRRGELMPGVEVLANALHTMLRARFYRETPDWLVPIIALFVAAAATLLLTFAQGRFEAIKHLAAIASLFIAILSLSYLVFTRELVVPPLAPALLSCMTAVMLALARRSLVISADLDARIAELAEARTGLAASADESWDALETTPAALIARLADADAAAIVETHGAKPRLLAHHGEALRMPAASGNKSYHAPHSSIAQALAESEPASRYFSFDDDRTADFIQRSRALSIQLSRSADGGRSGALLLAYSSAQPPSPEILLLCREIAGACLDRERTETPRISRNWWPRGGEWKARMLAALNRRLLARACFVERALHSVEDGLLVASPDGRIVFANPRAAKIFGLPARLLIGSDLFERIMTAGCGARADESVLQLHSAREILQRLLVERLPVEREIAIGEAPARHYVARLSAVADERAGVMGVVASLSDITRQRQLQQTQNDVMALVTHEMKTPLTAIRGISEVLAKFEVDGPRSREMHLAINEEAKRLTRMIDEYLDITRLESGARPPRFELTSPAQVLDRALLLLDPVAAERGIHLLRRIAPDLPALALDADLISRAVTNLVSNAIKYSSPGAGVIVDARAEAGSLRIKVADRGCGIPAESLPNIFEKFYRVPRLENMEVNGTGLGLALVREIAELHGGRVTVQSKTGAGSVFTLELPLRS
jgi:two-component system phosphate regulon sensor histidine kinase PhoR